MVMRKLFWFLFLTLFLVGCMGPQTTVETSQDPTAPATATINEEEDMIDEQIQSMAAEYRELRTVPGHFGGGAWVDDVDAWGGRKHELMQALGSYIASSGLDRETAVNLLGSPDQIVDADHPLYNVIHSLPAYQTTAADDREFLVYYWRGEHDFLFLVSEHDIIVNTDWWYAGE